MVKCATRLNLIEFVRTIWIGYWWIMGHLKFSIARHGILIHAFVPIPSKTVIPEIGLVSPEQPDTQGAVFSDIDLGTAVGEFPTRSTHSRKMWVIVAYWHFKSPDCSFSRRLKPRNARLGRVSDTNLRKLTALRGSFHLRPSALSIEGP